MKEIISDKDLRALIKAECLDDNNAHFFTWCEEDQEALQESVFDSLDEDSQRTIFDEAIFVFSQSWKDDYPSAYRMMCKTSGALPDYMMVLLEDQIDRAMNLINQIRDEENRN